jgi:hypothetical protein
MQGCRQGSVRERSHARPKAFSSLTYGLKPARRASIFPSTHGGTAAHTFNLDRFAARTL